ncbi:MAG TPA: M48 family metallopeptidase [Jatrophihabitantaceae bacterium]|nr:M48 family metallopeptidase [Jatrophihabitantaceae bacterium]
MNFFERQHRARGTSLRLVLLFLLAVIGIVAVIDLVVLLLSRNQTSSTIVSWIVVATIVTLLIIVFGMISKTIALRAGGAAVATSVGAVPVDPTTTDPSLRRYVNIVEEMSLASGVPTPRLFVLEREEGINAFAAGFSPADAAITVTSGALQQLNRDELQGVIGHEFSHILNGDMRLNIRLIGLLNGILLLGLIGLRFLAWGGGRGDKKGGAGVIVAVAVAMLVLGFVGQFFAGLIKAAVSRQREWLADASAVQFTRQTTGLEGALKKIAGLPAGSALNDSRGAREVSHMLFGEGTRKFSSLYATHPPLSERIAALDPTFTSEQYAELIREAESGGPAQPETAASFADAPAAAPSPSVGADPAQISARVGTMTADDLARGAALSAQIPPTVRQLVGQPTTVVPVVLALALNREADIQRAQLDVVARRLGPAIAAQLSGFVGDLPSVEPVLRLPIVSIALPALTARPIQDLDAILATLQDLARADNRIDVFEYCLVRLIGSYVADARDPARRSQPGRLPLVAAQGPALTLLAAIAHAGNPDAGEALAAFAAAATHLLSAPPPAFAPPADLWGALDAGWGVLDALDPLVKARLVEAVVIAVQHDGVLTVDEAELLRTTCALLHLPIPALVA